MRTVLNKLLLFLVLVIVQVFFLKNLLIYNISIPYLYVLFILSLPRATPTLVLYLCSFALGLIIDLFLNTPGVHTAACILTAYLRIILIGLMSYYEKTERTTPSMTPNKRNLKAFLVYTIALVLAHGISLSILEAADFKIFVTTLRGTAYSILLTLALILIIQLLPMKRTSSNE